MPRMRAKLRVSSVQDTVDTDGNKRGENLVFIAVARNAAYPADGSDEDNTFAKFSPSATFNLHCANPALFGGFIVGEKYYVDFTLAEIAPNG